MLAAIGSGGSLTAAADALGVSQSSVSLALRDFESQLGVALFHRTTRRVTPTAAGAIALASAGELLTHGERFVRDVRLAGAAEAGTVTFAATAAIAAAFGPRLLRRFARTHPDARVRMLDVAPGDLCAAVQSGEAAFSLGTPTRQEAGVTVDRLAEDMVSAITWSGGPFAGRSSIAWSELAAVRTVSVLHGGGIRELIDRALRDAGRPAFSPDAECRFLATALGMANERLGILVLPASVVAGQRRLPLAAIPLVDPPVPRQIALLRRAGGMLPPLALDLIAETKRLASTGIYMA